MKNTLTGAVLGILITIAVLFGCKTMEVFPFAKFSKTIPFDASKTQVKLSLDFPKNKQYIGYLVHYSDVNTLSTIDSFNTGQRSSFTWTGTGTNYDLVLSDGELGGTAMNTTSFKVHSYVLTLTSVSTSFGVVSGTDQSGKTQTFNLSDIFSMTPGSNGGVPTVAFGVVNLEDASKK